MRGFSATRASAPPDAGRVAPNTAQEAPMKDGIHPNYREVCFQDLSNGFKFVTRSCAQTKETIKLDDGREAAADQAGNHQRDAPVLHRHAEERGQPGRSRREVPQQVRPRRPQEVTFAAARSKAASAAFFFVAARRPPRAAASSNSVNSPKPALVTQARRAPPAAPGRCCCCAPPTCCRACSAATPGATPTSRPSARWWPWPKAARPGWRPRWAACRPTPRCCRTGWARPSSR
jgi:hypothetical protein